MANAKNKIYFVLVSFFASAFLFSCKNNDVIEKDGLLSCKLIGDLEHVQYWDSHDEWDVSSLSVELLYDDGTIETVPATDNSITLSYYPESPTGLDHRITEFSIIEGWYTDYKGNQHSFGGRTFSGISIIDYPYSSNNESAEKNYLLCFIIIPIILIFAFCIAKGKQSHANNLKK